MKCRIRPLSRLCLLIGLCLIGACSTGTRLAYNHLDTLASWQLSTYVELDAAQKATFDSAFKSAWDWHRATQLPAYAKDLRALAGDLGRGPPSREAAQAFVARLESHGEALGDRLLAEFEPLMVSLGDAQADHLVAVQLKMIDKEERKRADESLEARRRHFEDRAAEAFAPWIGEFDDEQKALVERAWTAGLPTLRTPEQRRQTRLDNLKRFAALLASRRQPGFANRFKRFGDDDPARDSERGRADAASEERGREMALAIVTHLNERQRTKLRGRLLTLAADCEALSEKTGTKTGTASIAGPGA